MSIAGDRDITLWGKEAPVGGEGRDYPDDTWWGRCLLLFSVELGDRRLDGVFVRWFESPEDSWNTSLNLRPLVWHK